MEKAYDISIIIVNYNTASHLSECLISIEKNLKNISYETIVVDNNSADREIENFPEHFPNVRFFLRNSNEGFGSGCNFGVSKALGKHLLFLNPDILLKDDSVKELMRSLKENESYGIVSGVMRNNENSLIYFYNNFPSYTWEIYHLTGLGYNRKIDQLLDKKEIGENTNFEVDWFHGAFFMIRKEDFIKTGGFNENYFIYYEDVDICFKVKMILGKKVVCIPSVSVIHHTKASLSKEENDNVYIYHLNRGKIIFFKNYSFIKRSILHLTGSFNIILRIICLPFWNKYNAQKKEKLKQLLKILKLYFSSSYVDRSKYEYIKMR